MQRLLAYEAGEAPPPTTARKSGAAAAKTPRTSRKAAPSPDKAALLRAAASTPLPTGQREDAADAEQEEEEEAPRSSRGVRRRLSAQAAAAASPVPRRPAAKQRPAVAGLATPVFWLLLLTAAAAGLAALAVPYCQQHDCAELARHLPERATDAASGLVAQARSRVAALSLPDGAAGAYAQARARALAAVDAAQAQWAALVGCCRRVVFAALGGRECMRCRPFSQCKTAGMPTQAAPRACQQWYQLLLSQTCRRLTAVIPRLSCLQVAQLGKGSSGPSACHFDAATALHSIMPVGQQFTALRQAAATALSSDGAEPADKVGSGCCCDGCCLCICFNVGGWCGEELSGDAEPACLHLTVHAD